MAALNDYLFAAGLSIKGCGSNNGQTIRGRAFDGDPWRRLQFGAMQEMVVGLHLITGPNSSSIWNGSPFLSCNRLLPKA